MKNSGFRPYRGTIAASAGILIAMIGVASYHPLMAAINGGRWCARLAPNGKYQVVYGNACTTHKPERVILFQMSQHPSRPLQ